MWLVEEKWGFLQWRIWFFSLPIQNRRSSLSKIYSMTQHTNRSATFNFLTVMKNLDQCSYKKEWITFSFHSRKYDEIIVKERGNQKAWNQNMVSKYDRAIKQLIKLLLYLDLELWCSQMLKFEMCLKCFLLIIFIFPYLLLCVVSSWR